MSSTRRYALMLAATVPLAACGSPSATENTTTTTTTTEFTPPEAVPNQQLPEAVPAENATTPVETAKADNRQQGDDRGIELRTPDEENRLTDAMQGQVIDWLIRQPAR